MTAAARSVDALIADLTSADFIVRDKSLAALVRCGREATAALLVALDTGDPELRFRAARGLSEIDDPLCTERFVQLLDDADPRIRSQAAYGLTRLGDPRALDALVRTIDDLPDVLHFPSTLSTEALATLGTAGLSRVTPLLVAADPTTRERAFLVIQRVLQAQPGIDWPALWRELGSYRPRVDEPTRDQAAGQWRDWIAQRFPA